MVFAAQLLQTRPELRNPTVIIVVDRINLDSQIGGAFDAADVANVVKAQSRTELEHLLRSDTRQTLITTIFKFAEADGVLNSRDNIIVLVDEAHRTQEGDLGRKMREALPNAFMFGLTGTPISRKDRNTFVAFGDPDDRGGYMNRYSYRQAIADEAILPVRFEPRLVELRVDRTAIDEGFDELASEHALSDEEKAVLSQRGGRLSVLLKDPSRLAAIADDIVDHYISRIDPSGLKGMVVMVDREACVRMKQLLDARLGSDASEVVMITSSPDLDRWAKVGIQVAREDWERWKILDDDRTALEALIDRFEDPSDPLRLLIVTNKLLTGFDAPICQVMYLDKPLRDHTLLQAICRTNRLAPGKKYGLIVDYLGVFERMAEALDYNAEDIEGVVANIAELKADFPAAIGKALARFPGVDRTVGGFEGLIAAQDCLPSQEARDAFARDYSKVSQLWEVVAPDAVLTRYETDYRWLTDVYQSLRPPSGIGKLVWEVLGPKTTQLIHDHVNVERINTDLETLVLDADLILRTDDPGTAGKEVELTIRARLHNHEGDSRFEALGERLERIRAEYEQGVLSGIEYLRRVLDLATDVVKTEQETNVNLVDEGKRALTQVFEETRTDQTPETIRRIVDDIDRIVYSIRFDGWQTTKAGEREVQRAIRTTLLRYQLHKDQDLFDRVYGYVKQHY
jgi:type I restriction enzyme R subunit